MQILKHRAGMWLVIAFAAALPPSPTHAQDDTMPSGPPRPPPSHRHMAHPPDIYRNAKGDIIPPPRVHIRHPVDPNACYLPKYTQWAWDFVNGYRKTPPPNWCDKHALTQEQRTAIYAHEMISGVPDEQAARDAAAATTPLPPQPPTQ